MKGKNGIITFITFILIITIFSAGSVGAEDLEAPADSNLANKYFYKQLEQDQSAKLIYDTLENMKTSGIFISGNLDAKVDNLTFDPTKTTDLLNSFSKAVDAFEYDNPDLFYIDYSKLSIRGDNNGIYIGIGREDNYFLRGYTQENVQEKINEYEKALDTALKQVEVAKINAQSEGKDETLEQIYAAHDYITKNTKYLYETDCSKKNNLLCNHRTSYDALINHEGVCEAYTRSFKAILDRLNIPTITVYGLYRVSENNNQPHIWNYVYYNEQWYVVDVTQDDPANYAISSTRIESGKENKKYCMVGAVDINATHIPVGVLSDASYTPFIYPELLLSTSEEKEFYNVDDKLKVKLLSEKYTADGDNEIINSGSILLSYDGKDYTENANEGKYLIFRYWFMDQNSNEIKSMDWAYVAPEVYELADQMEPKIVDNDLGGHYVYLPLPQVLRAQFAVTDIKPEYYITQVLTDDCLYFKGDPALIKSVTPIIENENGTYVAPPYPKTISPSLSGRMTIGNTYPISITFNQDVNLRDGETVPKIDLTAKTLIGDEDASKDAVTHSVIDNIVFNENSNTLSFNFTPSKYYSDDLCRYEFSFPNIVSFHGKNPFPIVFIADFPTNAGCSLARSRGWTLNAFGQPRLLADQDLSNILPSEDGTIYSTEISHRLALVSTTTSQAKQDQLIDYVSETMNTELNDIKAYNISLNLCKRQIENLKQGGKVKVCIGFPAGYNSSSQGTKYVAYHYKEEDGVLVGVEEINVEVTEYGLILYLDSFSPFLIGTTTGENTTEGKYFISISGDGTVSTSNGTIENNELKLFDNSTILTFKSGTSSELDSVSIDGVAQDINNAQLVLPKITTNKIIQVSFVSSVTKDHDDKRNETTTIKSVSLSKENDLIKANVTGSNSDLIFNWYRDGILVQSGNNSEYQLKNEAIYNGTYYVVVVSKNSGTATSISSETIEVNKPFTTIIFDPNGGTFPEGTEQVVFYTNNSEVKPSNNPVKLGYIFDKWELDSSRTSSNTKYFIAIYKEDNSKIITPVLNGGFIVSTDDCSKLVFKNNKLYSASGSELTNLPEAQKDGYRFDGWFSDETLTKQINEIGELKDLEFMYAGFSIYESDNSGSTEPTPSEPTKPDEQKYSITASISPSNAGLVYGTGRYAKGTKVTLTAVAKEGFKFENWTYGSVVIGKNPKLSIAVDQSAKYTANFVKVENTNDDPNAIENLSLDKEVIYLSTLKGEQNLENISAVIEPEGINIPVSWSISNKIVELKSDTQTATVIAKEEGLASLTATAGDKTVVIPVIVSNSPVILNSVSVNAKTADEYTVSTEIISNPALNENYSADSLTVYTWSNADQKDMRAKIVNKSNSNNWTVTFPVNDNNSFYDNAEKVIIHIYANKDNKTYLIGNTEYKYSNYLDSQNLVLGTAYSQNIGFIKPSVARSEILIGTVGEARQLEGVRLSTPIEGVELNYQVHMANVGWGSNVSQGTYAGTMHENRQLEAIMITLSGENKDNYKVEYQAHVKDKGWLDWVSDGQIAGTTGEARRMEAIKIRIVKK